MFKAYRFVYIAIIACFALTQCTSAPKRTQAPQERPDVQQQTLDLEDAKRSADWLDDAWQASNDIAKNSALVQAALTLQDEKQWQKSAAILSRLDKSQLTNDANRYFRLAKGRWYAHNEQWSLVYDVLNGLPERFTQKEYKRLTLELLAFAASERKQYWQALIWQVEAQRYSDEPSPQLLWQTARWVTQSQLPEARPRDLILAGWWRLIDNHHQAMTSPESFARLLDNWQNSFPNHPAQELVRSWKQANSEQAEPEMNTAKTIAVLLPLSGQYEAQGLAVRDGIIAKVSESTSSELVFIDTNALSFEQQQSKVQELKPAGIIGPLLKESVTHWVNQTNSAIPQVFLNQLDNNTPQSAEGDTALFFALNPETEAEQASEFMSSASSQTKRPLVLAADTPSSKRMVERYKASWSGINEPSVSLFSQRDDMKSAVETSLGLIGSKERIRAVKIAAGKIIVDEQERSRRDISGIYLPGNLQQVRLLKPFIDVSISPFAQRILVYGTSSAHELSNQLGDNDLNGLIFSETPWLVQNNGKNVLLNQWLEARPGWGLSQARLAAMGYDSVDLVQRLTIMQRMPGTQLNGLSGTLNVEQQIVQRQLQWAAFRNGRLTVLEEQPSAGKSRRQ
ncbi:MAG: penicillin-binding protein activator [Idiomarina piscisalsi]|nr:penicillin-binding protein activator [Idiomarina piscisalsi]